MSTIGDDEQIQPVPVETAAVLLGVSRQAVPKFVEAGLLFVAAEKPRLLLDAARLREVAALAADLRATGTRDPELLDRIWHRLDDEAWLDNADLMEGFVQMA